MNNLRKWPTSRYILIIGFILTCLLLWSWATFSDLFQKKMPIAHQGVIDLRDWNFKDDGPVKLNGDWAFYWHQFKTFNKSDPISNPSPDLFVPVPGLWQHYILNKKKLPVQGYATYHLTILLNQDQNECMNFAIANGMIFSAFKVIVDGQPLYNVGIPGKSIEETTSSFGVVIKDFPICSDQVQLTIHMSNFIHHKSGIGDAFKIGLKKDLYRIQYQTVCFEIFQFAGILIIGLYYFALFIYRHQEHIFGILGVLCFVVSIRPLMTSGFFIAHSIKFIGPIATLQLDYFSIYLGMNLFGLSLYSLFPAEFNKSILKGYSIFTGIIIAATLFTSPVIFTHIFKYYLFCILAISIFFTYVSFHAYKNKREGSEYFFISWMVMFFTIINDILFSHRYIHGVFLSAIGILIFLLFQAAFLSSRYSKLFNLIEEKNTQIQESELRYQSIFENTLEGIFIAGPNGPFQRANPSMAQILGYQDPEELIKTVTDFRKQLFINDNQYQEFLQRISLRESIVGYEMRFRRKDGSFIWVLMNARPIAQDHVGTDQILGMATDITQIKNTGEKLIKSLAEKEHLLKEVHHRVKNNLQIINGLLSLTRMRSKQPESIKLLTDTSARILAMALIHTQLYESAQFDQINIDDSIRRLATQFKHGYAFPGKTIQITTQPSELTLNLNQAVPCILVINELFSNAFKHAFNDTDNGLIQISVNREDGNIAHFVVKDNGCGFSEDLFSKSSQSLGLRLIKGLIEEQLNGKVEYKLDSGTEVHFRFKTTLIA